MKKPILLIAASLFAMGALSKTLEEMMASPEQIIDGKPIAEFANIWWQWTYSIPKELSPVRDLTGEHCQQGQFQGVWFLAGGFGSSTIRRKCEIPDGKYIFFPVINMAYWNPVGGALSCEQVKELAALNNDNLISIDVTLDSVGASNPAHTRLASEQCFDLLGLTPATLNPPKLYPADGYWVMLKPLSKGVHHLKFQAKYDRENGAYSQMAQDIEYELTIK